MSRTTLLLVILFFLSLLFWEMAATHFADLLFVLPTPSAICKTLWESRQRLLFHAGATFKEMFWALSFALCCSLPLSFLMMRFKMARQVLQPLFVLIQCVPLFTLGPIMVIWFGWGFTAIIIPSALMILFPLTITIYQGLISTPKELVELFQTNGATAIQTFLKLRLPSALPHFFAGLKIGAAIAGIGAIAGEWVGANQGLGILMLESRRNTDLELTFSALVLLTALTMLFYLSISLIEKMINRGKFAYRKLTPLLLLLLTLSSCTKPSDNHSQTRLLLDWLPSPTHIPLFAGLEKGFFAEEGISLYIQKMQESGGGISYLTSHGADLIVGHMPSAVRAKARGANIKIIGSLIKEPLCCLLYLDDHHTHQPKDLSDKTFGYCLSGQDDSAFLDYLLTQGQILPKTRLNVGFDIISSIGTRRVDCIYGAYWNIEPIHLESLGCKTAFFKMNEFAVPNHYELIILANNDSKESNPLFVAAFQRALQKSLDFCKSHPDEAFEAYVKHNLDKREQTLVWEKKSWNLTHPLLANDQIIDFETLKTFSTWLDQQCGFSKTTDFQSLIP